MHDLSSRIIFRDLMREWWERYLLRGCRHYALESWRRLEKIVFPVLGDMDPRKITPPMILAILRPIEAQGHLVKARRIKSHISQSMRYGIACGWVESDPTRDLGFALTPYQGKPRAAILEPREIGELMKRIHFYRFRQRRLSLLFAALTFVRPGEITSAAWNEIEWETMIWRIPAEKMKMKRPHMVPLARQTLEVLRELKTLTGNGPWLFPSRWDKSKHEKSTVLTFGLRSLGYSKTAICAHGFRAMAATSLSDMGWPSDLIERQLAHIDKNRVRAAYQRSELMEDRRKMMQAWADFLDLKCAYAILGR